MNVCLIFSGIAKLLCKCMVTKSVNLSKIWSTNYLYDHFSQRLHIHQTSHCYFTQVLIFHYPVSITITFFSKFIIAFTAAGYFLDYKTERNVTKHSLNRVCVFLFWEEKVLHVSLSQSTSVSTSKLYTSIGNPKFNVSDARRRFFPYYIRAQNMVRVIEGKII